MGRPAVVVVEPVGQLGPHRPDIGLRQRLRRGNPGRDFTVVTIEGKSHGEHLATPARDQEDVRAPALIRGGLLHSLQVRPPVPAVDARRQHEPVHPHHPGNALAVVAGPELPADHGPAPDFPGPLRNHELCLSPARLAGPRLPSACDPSFARARGGGLANLRIGRPPSKGITTYLRARLQPHEGRFSRAYQLDASSHGTLTYGAPWMSWRGS
jgi:hypothetical protein